MKYLDFINTFKEPAFNLQDLRVAGLGISSVQLSQWTKKKYLLKIKNGAYVFTERKNQLNMEAISRLVFEPSYISLERALSKHRLIPEIVYNCTSVTTKKTTTIKNSFGIFIFRNIKKKLFFGYDKIKENGSVYFLAEPEKALLDYLYLNSYKINNQDDVSELRLNEFGLKELNQNKINEYLKIFNSKKLQQIVNLVFSS
jgi:predicted transcriptional regulator of viral defense system